MNAIALLAALTVFRVDPLWHRPILPHADPECGVVTNEFPFAAAQGEFEAVSFVVRPDADYEKVDVVASDLTGPGGAKIPASAADVALVKVWFRPGGRWTSYWAGGRGNPEPMNNLILHDDAVVKVDFTNKINWVRGEYSDGVYYMNMSRSDRNTPFNDSLEPVRDAPKFVPFDLKKDFRQQYLVTWRVPKDAKGGDYRGTVTLVTPTRDAPLATLELSLHVHPFTLPRPRTHYDSSQPYVSYWMGTPSLEGLLKAGHRMDRAEKKLRAILRNMVEHNAINLSGVGTLAKDSLDDYGLRTLLIARQEGMSADPLINGGACDFSGGFVWAPGSTPLEPEQHPEKYRRSLEGFRRNVQAQVAIMDKYLGHHNCYYNSLDECGAGTNRRSYGYWSIVHELGGMIWTDYAYTKDSGAFIDMNDVPASVDHVVNNGWHQTGGKAVSYAAPFTGPEDPDIWRRVKGIRMWYADLDGPHEYAFLDADNRWNEFVYRGRYCQFGMGFRTIDGMISTLAWEGVRESLDDVRYYTLLRKRAEAALKSSDAAVRRLGRDALVWQDAIDPEYVVDLDAFRLEVSAWIERLIAKVGPEPADVDTELPPPAALPAETRPSQIPSASAGAKAIFAYADACGFRYDLALEALYRLWRDESAAAADRATAAIRISRLHSEMRERVEAVKVLDETIPLRNLTQTQRGKLHLQRVKVMMTDEKFEEIYSEAQLDKSATALAAALRFSGASEDERFGAIQRMAGGYLQTGAFEKCIAFVNARLEDTKISAYHKSLIFITVGNAWKGLQDWEKALKAFSEAHRAHNNERDFGFRRQILVTEADAAEKAQDYNRAVACWTDLIPTYGSEEKDQKARAIAQVRRLQPLARKNSKIDIGTLYDDDSKDTITLDE